ncbi:error-prone DNA polymerase [Brevibacterium rongguiense]|nr:error-prone DNA polymerase [Brevibacterium rongguiense]
MGDHGALGMSRFFNPRTTWSELERRLSAKPAPAGTRHNGARRRTEPGAGSEADSTGGEADPTGGQAHPGAEVRAGGQANAPAARPSPPPQQSDSRQQPNSRQQSNTGQPAPIADRKSAPRRYEDEPTTAARTAPAHRAAPAAVPPPVSVGPRGSDGPGRSVGPGARPAPAAPESTGAGSAPVPTPRHAAPAIAYAELHAHSDFSFLDGASEPEDLVDAAADAGLSGLALTDHNGLYGAVRFAQRAAARGLPTVYGAELSLGLAERIPGQVDPAAEHLLVLARSVEGYRALSAAITAGNQRGEKNRPVFDLESLAAQRADWLILTGCRKGPLLPRLGDPDGGLGALRRLTDLFGTDRVAVELTRTGDPRDDERIAHLRELAARCDLPAVATNAVHYAGHAQFRGAQLRAAIRSHRSLEQLAGWLPPAAAGRIHTPEEMVQRFGPEPVAAAARLAAECAFELTAARAGLPRAPVPEGADEMERLRELVAAGALRRYGDRAGRPDAWALLDRELATIEAMGFAGYFLIVWDIARFCHDNDIFCQGRGSAANSAVCYVLGITAVDAVRFGLLFDRFLSPEREGYPDIDIDIESARREEVIQYTYAHYGRDRAAQVANVITYRAKSSVRDAAGALGFDPGQQDAFSKGLARWSSLPEPAETHVPAPVLDLAGELLGTPRHLGIHSGGMILADRPIGEVVPIEPATMEDRTVVQWDKDDCAAMNLVKFDLLGLGMLGALHEMVDLVAAHTGERIERPAIPQEDPEVYDMLCAADAVGVFQVESRAQLATLPRLRPRTFYDLAVQVALIRPGPIQGGSVHPYIRRRQGEEPVDFLHPALESSLGKTLGVPLFQEQLMQMAIDVAGFSGADADELRRAMGSRRSQARMKALRERFDAGCAQRGIGPELAEVIFGKIAAFANYGFPESHAISFANLVYDSAWFKRHHPAAFTAGLLRSQPMGFYSPQSLIADARRHGVGIRPVDIARSQEEADLEPDPDSTGGFAIRIGLRAVKGVGDAAEALVAERAHGAYGSVEDVAQRTGVEVRVLEALATAGAFDCFGLDRRQALWLAGSLSGAGPATLPGTSPVHTAPALPLMGAFDVTLAELFATGLTVDGYPTQQLRGALRARGYASTADARAASDGQRITVAGIITHRQRPGTASGITFMNIEDEFGMLNVVCSPGLMKRFAPISLTRATLVVTGLLQRAGEVVSLYAHKLVPLDVELPVASRNFR